MLAWRSYFNLDKQIGIGYNLFYNMLNFNVGLREKAYNIGHWNMILCQNFASSVKFITLCVIRWLHLYSLLYRTFVLNHSLYYDKTIYLLLAWHLKMLISVLLSSFFKFSKKNIYSENFFLVEHIKTFAVEKLFNKEKYFKDFSETTEPCLIWQKLIISLLFKRFVFYCVINQKSEMGHTSRKLYKRKNSIFAIIFQLPLFSFVHIADNFACCVSV